MAITKINRDYGDAVSIVRITSTDTLAVVGAVNYIFKQNANIVALNGGEFNWNLTDMVAVAARDGWAFYSISSDFKSLNPIFEPGAGTVTQINTNNGLTGGPITTTGTIGLAPIANNDLLANTSGISNNPIATSLTTLFDSAMGNTAGNMLYRSASNWTVTTPAANSILVTNASNIPSFTQNLPAGTNLPSPFSVNGTSVTTTGTQLNLLNALTLVPINKIVAQKFTTAGTFTYTPTAGMKYVYCTLIGAGGGGGGVANSNASEVAVASGGGSGATSYGVFSAATIGASQTITIGQGGTGGTVSGSNGGNGGQSSIGSLMTAPGGSGGVFTSSSGAESAAGGAGGVAGTGGDLNLAGTAGTCALGTFISGLSFGGNGANSSVGSGQPFLSAAAATAGGGGSGTASFNATGAHGGGPGGDGFCYIIEYLSA